MNTGINTRLTGLAISFALSRTVGSAMASRVLAGGSVRFSAGVTCFGGMDESEVSVVAVGETAAAAGVVVSGADILLVRTLVRGKV